MFVLPFAFAALLLVWFSAFGAERVSVLLLALAVPFIAAFVLAILWKWIGIDKCKSVRARRVNGVVALASLAIFISVPLTNWPLRSTYRLSQPSLDAIAESLQSGVEFPKPIWAGLFTIEKAEIYDLNGKICLWTDLNPSGKTGFVKCPSNDVPFNLWSMIELDEDWQYISED